MESLIKQLQGARKWRVFGIVLVVIVIAGTLISLATRMALLRDDTETRPRLAVVGPLTSASGQALQRGAQAYVDQINREGGVNGRKVELLAVEEDEGAPAKVTADKRVVGVIGHIDPALLVKAAPVYAGAKLRVVTPLPLAAPLAGVASLGLDPREEARFAANYARNIQKQRLMYVVREPGAQFDALVEPFLEVYKRFDTPVKQVWTLPEGAVQDADIDNIRAEMAKIDVGAVYVAARPAVAARVVAAIRASGSALEVFGPSFLATGEFNQALTRTAGRDAELLSHGIIVSTPVLFDTANDRAQRFQGNYQRAHAGSPDWLATTAYEAAHYALSPKAVEDTDGAVMGRLSFVDGQAQVPIQMGTYNGSLLISAPIQLLPIAKGASFNYIDALRQGRVLYVNDRFMFKTNVVYVGMTIHGVSDVDRQKETATLDLSVWFRYRGKFNPQDLQIANAVEPVKFDKPEEARESDDDQYRRYRIKQTFRLNFTSDGRSFEQQIAGLQFRHRLLNRNNLTYVVDVLGMPTGSALTDELRQRRAVKAGFGWELENAWVSQDVVRERGDGAPQYVGMTGEQPLFSTITLGLLLKPEGVAARDLVSPEYFIYTAIFGLLGVLAAQALDARKFGRFWGLQSWLLRLIFWPALLLAVGNLAIDWAFGHWPPPSTKWLVAIYDSLWWVLGAALVDMAVRRFIWVPLESTTGRKVPNVMKFIVTVLIFGLAFAGIIAVVFNQTLTSLLATSSVLALVVGVAIQSNIANVFSGIILNIERPFKVGDYIKINNVIGQVKDITWRTIRLESNDGPLVILANSKVSEAFMENYSVVPHGIAAETSFYAPAEADPKKVLQIITEAVDQARSVTCKTDPGYEPSVRYKGVVNLNGQWVGSYVAGYRVKILPKKATAREEIWGHVRERFEQAGIPLVPANFGEGAAGVMVLPAPASAPA
jgi:small-conductance mechanosensitive channel/ABC-type branched-subunit amino acid transport system substrate-binding protein